MERNITQRLIEWKESKHRKPLILLGARQVGKTYILKDFGKTHYKNVAYINCDSNPQAEALFMQDYDMRRIIMMIGAITNVNMVPGETLIILDEIQEVQRGLHALKYFCEEVPEHHVVVAGSLLGITMHQGESFPVGKVDMLTMYPMRYDEFLLAKGHQQLVDILYSCDWQMIKTLRITYIQLLREYYFVGGMPEAVLRFVETNDVKEVRQVQEKILSAYHKDISKHAPTNEVVRISQVWRSIPSQLGKENKKFIYGVVKKGGRAKDFKIAIQWLLDAGLVYKVNRVKVPKIPLSFYEDISAFKLFLLDTGLLGAMSKIPPSLMLTDNAMEEAKGAFTENYISSQLHAINDLSIYYYSKEDSTMEIDFLVQSNTQIIPIEVKAEENLKSKSLKTYIDNHPEQKGIRLSMSDYREQEWMRNIPLYASFVIFDQKEPF